MGVYKPPIAIERWMTKGATSISKMAGTAVTHFRHGPMGRSEGREIATKNRW